MTAVIAFKFSKFYYCCMCDYVDVDILYLLCVCGQKKKTLEGSSFFNL